MSISRRQFFRGLTPGRKDPQQDYRRKAQSVESYVRTLLPYDFALTEEQTVDVLRSATEKIHIPPDGALLDENRCEQLREIVEEKVQRWRDEYLKAEEARQRAIPFVQDFLVQAKPESLDRLKQRFHHPNSPISNEMERELRVWLSGLPNSRLAICDESGLRELVFSELSSWC